MDRREYYKGRIMALMADIEIKRNRYNKKVSFEVAFPELTETIWNTIDATYLTKDHKPLAGIVEQLNKLSNTL
jgi:hypothetical protein